MTIYVSMLRSEYKNTKKLWSDYNPFGTLNIKKKNSS